MKTITECHAPNEICTHKWMNGCITRYWICEHLTIKRDESVEKHESEVKA